MPLPVLRLELLHANHGRRQHRLRWLLGGWLVSCVFVFYALYLARLVDRGRHDDQVANLITTFVQFLLIQQVLLLAGSIPAFAAGSITDEKTRSRLGELLTTDLTSAEIILGKFLAQVIRALDLVLPGLPLLCFFGVLAGLEAPMLLVLAGSTLAPAFGLAALGMLASVWCQKTSNAVLVTYASGSVLFMLLAWLGNYVPVWSPLYPFLLAEGRAGLGDLARALLVPWLFWGGATVLCLGVALWRLRPAYAHQLEAAGRVPASPKPSRKHPPVGENPVRWKETYVGGLTDLPGMRRLSPRFWLLLLFLGSLGGAAASLLEWTGEAPGTAFAALGLVFLFLVSLAVGLRASGVVCGERERQTWDLLLLTPLEPRQILRSKLWGLINSARPFLLTYAGPVAVFSLLAGFPVFLVAASLWVATWTTMYFLGACGIVCSVRATSSWQALLSTLALGGRTFLKTFFFLPLPLTVIVSGLLWTCLLLVWPELAAGLVTSLLILFTGLLLLSSAEGFLDEAEKHLAQVERVEQRPVEAVPVTTEPLVQKR